MCVHVVADQISIAQPDTVTHSWMRVLTNRLTQEGICRRLVVGCGKGTKIAAMFAEMCAAPLDVPEPIRMRQGKTPATIISLLYLSVTDM